MYLPVADEALADFLTDNAGHRREGSLSPGAMPLATERALKDKAKERLPDYYLEIVERSRDTSAYAIYDCKVPAYRKARICLVGDAGAYARPHSGAGALKGMSDCAGGRSHFLMSLDISDGSFILLSLNSPGIRQKLGSTRRNSGVASRRGDS